MYFKVCMTCGSKFPDPSLPGDSHGFCPRVIPTELSFCAKVYLEWSKITGDRPDLHDYYRLHYGWKEEASHA